MIRPLKYSSWQIPPVGSGEKLLINGTEEAQTSFVIAQIQQTTTKQVPLVIVAPNSKRLNELYDDLDFFLRFNGSGPKMAIFPERDLHYHQPFLVGEHVSAERANVLKRLVEDQLQIILTTQVALGQKTIPARDLKNSCVELRPNEDIDLDQFILHCVEIGYRHVPIVQEIGQFARRGSIIDIFVPGTSLPIRIELFDTQIESLRFFDPSSQVSLKTCDGITVSPCSEIIFSDDNIKRSIVNIKAIADQFELSKSSRARYEEMLHARNYRTELEDLLSTFYESSAHFFDYLPKEAFVIYLERHAALTRAKDYEERLAQTIQNLGGKNDGLVDPNSWMPLSTINKQLEEYTTVYIEDLGSNLPTKTPELLFSFNRMLIDGKNKLEPLRQLIDKNYYVVISCHSEQQRKRVIELLRKKAGNTEEDSRQLKVVVGRLTKSVLLHHESQIYMPDYELFGLSKRRQNYAKEHNAFTSSELSQFESGNYVVHVDHGIGIYRGIQHLNLQEQEADFLTLEYFDGDILYVPVYRLNLLKNVTSDEEESNITLDRLGTSHWQNKKQKVREELEKMTKELLHLYASRKIISGHSYQNDDQEMLTFEAAFSYSETVDQAKAIADVIEDMQSSRPMDRLICGDVGFGKTEVAMRAAFLATLNKKQVAVLAPTTILSAQHEYSFKQRFASIPVNIEVLNRFKSASDQKDILERLETGAVDIIIGTHRLLSKDVKFKDLGLLVIDEEHRFGVNHKERIKNYRKQIDVISMTATPIPRSMQMSLYGFRDLSIIATPPSNRMAIKTFVSRFDDQVIHDAIKREIARDGQVFFIHNRIRTIDAMADYVQKLVPKARIGIAHAEQSESQLEKVMLKFQNHDIDILLSTTIVESGLDFPRANTMLINRADRFGLASLYQLRGRVGRSEREAFTYLLIPGEDLISNKANKRLRALKAFTELGSGYRIALRDLEIRGAGNLFGKKQSGQIRSVGIELYNQLLEETIMKLRGEIVEKVIEPELQLNLPAFIPEDYIKEESVRLKIYEKLSDCKDDKELQDLREEIVDRFGRLPDVVVNLVDTIDLKLVARRLSIQKIAVGSGGLSATFDSSTPVKTEAILGLVGEQPDNIRMLSSQTLFFGNISTPHVDIDGVKKLLQRLV